MRVVNLHLLTGKGWKNGARFAMNRTWNSRYAKNKDKDKGSVAKLTLVDLLPMTSQGHGLICSKILLFIFR